MDKMDKENANDTNKTPPILIIIFVIEAGALVIATPFLFLVGIMAGADGAHGHEGGLSSFYSVVLVPWIMLLVFAQLAIYLHNKNLHFYSYAAALFPSVVLAAFWFR